MRIRTLSIAAAILAATMTPASPALAQAPAPSAGGAVFGDGGGLTVEPGALLGDPLTISGSLAGAGGKTVRVERRDPQTGLWTAVATTPAAADGTFAATWKTDAVGPQQLRVVLDSTPARQATTASAGTPTGQTTVFRAARATWYGPGLWGRTTACGVRLTKATLGVAHRTLPCGTLVSVSFGGRQVQVPVIDRGPFAHGASFDLTQATAQAVGMTQTERVGWLRAAPAPAIG
jgi:rare lipoprotein A